MRARTHTHTQAHTYASCVWICNGRHCCTHTVLPKPARCTREAVDRFGIPNPRKSGSLIGADRQRFGPSRVLLKRVPQGRTESGGIVLAANAGPRVPSGGVTLKRRCTYRPSVIYLIVNKLLSLATRPNGEWGSSTRRQCWAASAQRRCHPEEALYLPTFSHLFDCQ